MPETPVTERDLDVILEAAHPSRPDRHELTRAAVERIVAARTADANARLAAVEALHTGLHRCTDGWFWVEVETRGCKGATVGLCPTLAVLSATAPDAEGVTCSGRCDSRQSDNPDAPDFPDPRCPRHGDRSPGQQL